VGIRFLTREPIADLLMPAVGVVVAHRLIQLIRTASVAGLFGFRAL
jgi:hypothetical protein